MTSPPARFCLTGTRAELLAGGFTLAGQPLNTPRDTYTADIDGGCEGRAALQGVNAVRARGHIRTAKPDNVEPNFNARLVIDGFSDAGSWRDALRFHPSKHGAQYDR